MGISWHHDDCSHPTQDSKAPHAGDLPAAETLLPVNDVVWEERLGGYRSTAAGRRPESLPPVMAQRAKLLWEVAVL
jgi:hypothetical protein